MIAAAPTPPQVADQFETHVVWMSEDEMLPGRRYLVKIGGSDLRRHDRRSPSTW